MPRHDFRSFFVHDNIFEGVGGQVFVPGGIKSFPTFSVEPEKGRKKVLNIDLKLQRSRVQSFGEQGIMKSTGTAVVPEIEGEFLFQRGQLIMGNIKTAPGRDPQSAFLNEKDPLCGETLDLAGQVGQRFLFPGFIKLEMEHLFCPAEKYDRTKQKGCC